MGTAILERLELERLDLAHREEQLERDREELRSEKIRVYREISLATKRLMDVLDVGYPHLQDVTGYSYQYLVNVLNANSPSFKAIDQIQRLLRIFHGLLSEHGGDFGEIDALARQEDWQRAVNQYEQEMGVNRAA